MAWIESHQSLATHRKTLALRRLLGLNTAETIGYLHLLWWWALDNAPTGELQNIDPVDLATAMQWPGEPKVMLMALTKCGFIDEDCKLHDWETYAGKLIIQRLSNRDRQRKHRENFRKVLLLESPKVDNSYVTVTSQLRHGATVPNRTQPNRTQPNRTMIRTPLVSPLKDKTGYGEFKNVLLTGEEYEKLEARLNSALAPLIEEMSTAIASHGYKYKSCYAAILNWVRKGEIENSARAGGPKLDKRAQEIKEKYGYVEPT